MSHHTLIDYFEAHVSLTAHERALIEEAYSVVELAKKEMLFEQGTKCMTEAFVVSGTLRVFYVDDKGSEHVLNFALPGWWVGDLASFYEGSEAFLNVQALEPSTLLVIDPEKKEKLFRSIPALERIFRIVIQKHLASLQKRLIVNHSMTADQRYKNLLEKIPMIEQLVPQYQIASYLGILPESLSRLKKKLLEEK
ncbi:MAG: Crp/Fnr family transcriptional regulator [Crocinitomicaceae bacterium]